MNLTTQLHSFVSIYLKTKIYRLILCNLQVQRLYETSEDKSLSIPIESTVPIVSSHAGSDYVTLEVGQNNDDISMNESCSLDIYGGSGTYLYNVSSVRDFISDDNKMVILRFHVQEVEIPRPFEWNGHPPIDIRVS